MGRRGSWITQQIRTDQIWQAHLPEELASRDMISELHG
jgi:hypothetical protein